jgi:protein gp37
MKKTKIEWCDSTINPVVGCTFGCPYCYAKRLNDRFGFVEDFSKPQFFPERLKQLYEKKPQIIFMDSMSDIADWDSSTIQNVFNAIGKNPQHNYLFLTKRPIDLSKKMYSCDSHSPSFRIALTDFPHCWFGVSITKMDDLAKIVSLNNRFNTKRKFISFEPLLSYLCLAWENIVSGYGWFIIGAETGNRKGKVIPKKEWIDDIVSTARRYDIPVFMKNSLLPIMGEENMLREFPKSMEKELEK